MGLILLKHLKSGLSSAKVYYMSLISELATNTSEAIEELASSQVSKPETYTTGNVIVTDTDGSFIDGGVKISVVSGKVKLTYDDGT